MVAEDTSEQQIVLSIEFMEEKEEPGPEADLERSNTGAWGNGTRTWS